MIVATAGHVDHGKTSLVRELTGIQTDTLREEVARGLSINLGYAHLSTSGAEPISFIDVPGHQRFMNTMISGISGIDMALLVVAADDGPMPQTREHLDILEILGVRHLIIAISKVDRVGEEQVDSVQGRIREMLLARPWTVPPFFLVSSETGEGIERLRSFFLRGAHRRDTPASAEGFRVSIDRRFLVKGKGLIVTGTASAGVVRPGDRLTLLPRGVEVRVRGLQTHDREVQCASAGQRVALNLAGKIERDAIERGDWLVDTAAAEASSRLDVSFRLLSTAPAPLKHMASIKLYLGAKRVAGKFAVIAGSKKSLAPGRKCVAQLMLDQPVSAMRRERFLLRDHGEDVILGGGRVLDPQGVRFGKSRPGRLVWLGAMAEADPHAALSTLLAAGQLVDLYRFWQISNRIDHPDPAAMGYSFEANERLWLVSQSRWKQAIALVLDGVEEIHARCPDKSGIRRSELFAYLGGSIEAELLDAVVRHLLVSGFLNENAERLRSATFAVAEADRELPACEAICSYLEGCKQRVPPIREMPDALMLEDAVVASAIKTALQRRMVVRISPARVALPSQVLWFADHVRAAVAAGEELTIIGLKGRFRLGRRLTIEVLEYFDSAQFTRRQGEARVIVNSRALDHLRGI